MGGVRRGRSRIGWGDNRVYIIIFSTYLDSHARDSAKKQHCHLVDQKPQVFDIKYKNDVILN